MGDQLFWIHLPKRKYPWEIVSNTRQCYKQGPKRYEKGPKKYKYGLKRCIYLAKTIAFSTVSKSWAIVGAATWSIKPLSFGFRLWLFCGSHHGWRQQLTCEGVWCFHMNTSLCILSSSFRFGWNHWNFCGYTIPWPWNPWNNPLAGEYSALIRIPRP